MFWGAFSFIVLKRFFIFLIILKKCLCCFTKIVMLLIFIGIDVNKSKYLKNYLKNTFYVLKKMLLLLFFFNCVEAKTKRRKNCRSKNVIIVIFLIVLKQI